MTISRRALLAGAAASLAVDLGPVHAADRPTITVYKEPT